MFPNPSHSYYVQIQPLYFACDLKCLPDLLCMGPNTPLHTQVSASLVRYKHSSHWIPDLRFLLHPVHTSCIVFIPSTPGPGFCRTPPITNKTAKTIELSTINPKQSPVTQHHPAVLKVTAHCVPFLGSSPQTHLETALALKLTIVTYFISLQPLSYASESIAHVSLALS
jgi:hypothetical protein